MKSMFMQDGEFVAKFIINIIKLKMVTRSSYNMLQIDEYNCLRY